LYQTEIKDEAVPADPQVLKAEVQNRPLKVPQQHSPRHILNSEVLERHVAVMEKYHQKGNDHDKDIF
jgi:hypothetical protein